MIKLGIAGFGRIGAAHAREVGHVAGIKVTAVCEPNKDLLAKALADYKTEGFSNYKTFLKEAHVDWVIICTPSHLHKTMTLQALAAGHHVMVEKPMAPTLADGKAMRAAAKKHKRMISVNQSRRYMPEFTFIKKELASKKHGKIFQAYVSQSNFSVRSDWQVWKKSDGGQVANWGVHLVDALLQLTNEKPVSVFARMNRVKNKGDAEDIFKIILNYKSGFTAEAEFLKGLHHKPQWHICGTKGTIVSHQTGPIFEVTSTLEGKKGNKDKKLKVDYRKKELQFSQLWHWKDFVAHLKKGKKPPVTIDSVLWTTAVLEAAYKSAKSGQAVKLPAKI